MFRTTILLSIIAEVVAEADLSEGEAVGSGTCSTCNGECHADLIAAGLAGSGIDACCTPDNQCGVDEGDCDSDNDCASGLQCGYNNCAWGDHANGQYEVGTNDCCSDADFRELCQCVGGFDHGQRCTQDPLEIGGMYWCYLSPETIATCPDQRISPEWGDYTPWSELACGGRGSGAADLALNIGVVVMVAAAALF
eukprot:gene11274-8548_t